MYLQHRTKEASVPKTSLMLSGVSIQYRLGANPSTGGLLGKWVKYNEIFIYLFIYLYLFS